jgi:hypothetical protein
MAADQSGSEDHFVFTPAEFEPSYNVTRPQQAYHDMAAHRGTVVRPDTGLPVLTRMADIAALTRHSAVRSAPAGAYPQAQMGAERPLIPLHIDGPGISTDPGIPSSAVCSIPCSHRNGWRL